MRSYAKDLENKPKTQRMRDGYSRWRRWRALFNWAYMRKYLKSQVGRKWDDVWSDIAATHDVRNYSDAEFRDAIKSWVHFDVVINEDGMYDRKGGRLYSYRTDEYYVDENGILKIIPKNKRYRYSPPKSKFVRFNGFEYYKHEGLWYEVVTKSVKDIHRLPTENWFKFSYVDAFGVPYYNAFSHYKEESVVVTKRAVGKRVIRKINQFLESKYYD